MGFELTELEILEARRNYYHYGEMYCWGEQEAINKAAQRKLVERLEQYIKEVYPLSQTASEILQELRKGVGLE